MIDCALKITLAESTFSDICDQTAAVPADQRISVRSDPLQRVVKVTGIHLGGSMTVRLHDAIGELVRETAGTEQENTELSTAGLKSGIYMLHVHDEAGNKSMHKIVVLP